MNKLICAPIAKEYKEIATSKTHKLITRVSVVSELTIDSA